VGNDDRVLSQAEIDALLSSSAPSAPAAKAPAAAPQPVKTMTAPPPPKVATPSFKAPPPPAKQTPPPPLAKADAPVKTAVNTLSPVPEKASAPVPAQMPVVTPGISDEQVNNICRRLIAEQTKDLNKQVMELTIKVNKSKALNKHLAQLEVKISELTEVVKSSPEAITVLDNRLEEIYTMLGNMRREKHKNDEERIHDQFLCVNCHSEKLVAIHVKCTSCGMENWMGWFPDSGENNRSR
jgi:hypothetical protein